MIKLQECLNNWLHEHQNQKIVHHNLNVAAFHFKHAAQNTRVHQIVSDARINLLQTIVTTAQPTSRSYTRKHGADKAVR